jgi:hypothetical protein
MSFVAPGPSTSVAEVTNVSRHGFWLLLGQEELFVPFSMLIYRSNRSVIRSVFRWCRVLLVDGDQALSFERTQLRSGKARQTLGRGLE